jgi:hypothetical protein
MGSVPVLEISRGNSGSRSATVKGALVLAERDAANGDGCSEAVLTSSPCANLKSGALKGDTEFKGGAQAVMAVEGFCAGLEWAGWRFPGIESSAS